MNSVALKPLSERIEETIRTEAEAAVSAALAAARDAAFRAYADALRPICGRPFDVLVVDALATAERTLQPQACQAVERIRTHAVVQRMTDAA